MPRPDLRAVAAVAAVAALTGCGASHPRPRAPRNVPPALAAATRTEPAAAVTGTSTTSGSGGSDGTTATGARALRHLDAELNSALRSLGPQVGALVIDLSAGDAVLYERAPDVGRPPASLEKLYTSIAMLETLGPTARLSTDVLGTGELGTGGIWHGNLYLRGDGDPTFGDSGYVAAVEHGQGTTPSQLVTALQHAGIRKVDGAVCADASRFDGAVGGPATGNAPDLPDYGGELSALVFDHGATGAGEGPAVFAARELVITMRGAGIATGFGHRPAVTPPGARILASVQSPTVAAMLRMMDVPSDDLFADLFAKQLGFRASGHGTLATGAAAIAGVLASDFGLHPIVLDGSGLDKQDRSSPVQIVSLLRQLWQTADGRVLEQALPIVGQTGTVQFIGAHTAAAGRCEAKTGTLDDVTNLAGYCAARSGGALAFAVLIDGPENWQAIGSLNRIVGAIAGY